MMSSKSERLLALTCWLLCGVGAPAGAQGRPLTVLELSQMYLSGGDVVGWDEFDIPEFVAATYGARARQAVEAILAEPSTIQNYYLQLEALTTAQYGRVGVPIGAIMPYASGAKGAEVGGLLRHRAMMALRLRADDGLVAFWHELARDPDPSFRQLAAAGLSCSLGGAALTHLHALRSDSNQGVARVAEFYRSEHVTKGPAALACGGRVTRDLASTFPSALRAELRQRGEAILRRIP